VSKLPKPSFSKALFSGVLLDELIFPYPEMDKEEKENFELMRESFKKFANDKVDPVKIDKEAEIPQEIIDELKELGFFGMIIPEEYEGFGFSTTAYVKMLEAITEHDPSIALTLGAHQSIGLKSLLMFGTEDQKKKYLR